MSRDACIPPPTNERGHELCLNTGSPSAVRRTGGPDDGPPQTGTGIPRFLTVLYRRYARRMPRKSNGPCWVERRVMRLHTLTRRMKKRVSWQGYSIQKAFHTREWRIDERLPARMKHGIAAGGLNVDPFVFFPLTMPQHRVVALGVSDRQGPSPERKASMFCMRLSGVAMAAAQPEQMLA